MVSYTYKTLMKLVKKKIEDNARIWYEVLFEAIWGHRIYIGMVILKLLGSCVACRGEFEGRKLPGEQVTKDTSSQPGNRLTHLGIEGKSTNQKGGQSRLSRELKHLSIQ